VRDVNKVLLHLSTIECLEDQRQKREQRLKQPIQVVESMIKVWMFTEDL
jgi:hypothetical protein